MPNYVFLAGSANQMSGVTKMSQGQNEIMSGILVSKKVPAKIQWTTTEKRADGITAMVSGKGGVITKFEVPCTLTAIV